jgi:mono/diheme cytochrome c family protein
VPAPWRCPVSADDMMTLAPRTRTLGRTPMGVLPLLACAMLATACSWFTDFKEQPDIDPWQSPNDTIGARGQPQMSVPVTGSQVPGYAVSYQRLGVTIDSMAGLRNPVAADARSLENGRKYYQINCAVCHGMAGGAKPTVAGGGALGDGPVSGPKYGLYPPSLLGNAVRLSDGYIWGIIRNGRGAMPTYDRIEDMDRWDVVNYIRALQKDVVTVPVTAAGKPGETGRTLPGYTRIGPTRPAPFWKPNGTPSADSLGATATPPDSAAHPETPQ